MVTGTFVGAAGAGAEVGIEAGATVEEGADAGTGAEAGDGLELGGSGLAPMNPSANMYTLTELNCQNACAKSAGLFAT
jgi:hypothetical protein